MRRIVPETHAVLRGMIYSKPSPEMSVTYSEGVEGDGFMMSDERVKEREMEGRKKEEKFVVCSIERLFKSD